MSAGLTHPGVASLADPLFAFGVNRVAAIFYVSKTHAAFALLAMTKRVN